MFGTIIHEDDYGHSHECLLVARAPISPELHTPRNLWSWKHVCLPVGDTAEQFPRWYHSALQPQMSESPSCPTIVTLVSLEF